VKVFLVYQPRRVSCKRCGIKVERVPWSTGKDSSTTMFKLFICHWAKYLSWKEVACEFGISWQKVFSSVEYVVNWGLSKRDLSGVTAIGIDEIKIRVGHRYATLVYQLNTNSRRLLWIGEARRAKTLLRFFKLLGKEQSGKIEYVCSDMWQAYLKVIKKKIPKALHILDRFHIVANLNKALAEVRAKEARQLESDGYEAVLKNTKYTLMKRKENLTKKQSYTLKELLTYNLKSVKAYLLKEDFNNFWKYTSVAWAEKFLDAWIKRVMYSKIKPMKKQARSIRKHKSLILNWFRAKKQFSSGIVEGFNCKAKLTMRKAYGFRTFKGLEIALYHAMGDLPEPEIAHRFW